MQKINSKHPNFSNTMHKIHTKKILFKHYDKFKNYAYVAHVEDKRCSRPSTGIPFPGIQITYAEQNPSRS